MVKPDVSLNRDKPKCAYTKRKNNQYFANYSFKPVLETSALPYQNTYVSGYKIHMSRATKYICLGLQKSISKSVKLKVKVLRHCKVEAVKYLTSNFHSCVASTVFIYFNENEYFNRRYMLSHETWQLVNSLKSLLLKSGLSFLYQRD